MLPLSDPSVFSVSTHHVRTIGCNEISGQLPHGREGGMFSGVPPCVEQSLYCCYYNQMTFTQPWWLHRREQPFLLIEYVYAGALCIRSNEEMYKAEAGDLVLLLPHRDNIVAFQGGKTCEKAGFVIMGGLLDSVIDSMALNRLSALKVEDEPCLESYFQRLRQAVKMAGSPLRGNIETYAELCGQTIQLLQYITMLPEIHHVSERAHAIRDYIHEHVTENFYIEELCRVFGMSQPVLNRCFREVFKTTPWNYLVGLRLERAAEALRNTDDTLKKIALESGYNSMEHFQAVFKQHYGISPGRYRKFGGIGVNAGPEQSDQDNA